MRIPWSKIYRAFPELDQFTDAQCEGYVREARAQHGAIVWGWGVAGVLAFFPGLGLTCLVGVPLDAAFSAFGADDTLLAVVGLAVLIGGVASGCVSMTLRDIGLRKAIGKRLEGARCAKCSYSLLGLVVSNGMVTCPECGAVEDIADRGLSAADILAVEAVPGGSSGSSTEAN